MFLRQVKIRFTRDCCVGTHIHVAGDTLEVDELRASHLVKSGAAVLAPDLAAVEAATAPPAPETAKAAASSSGTAEIAKLAQAAERRGK